MSNHETMVLSALASQYNACVETLNHPFLKCASSYMASVDTGHGGVNCSGVSIALVYELASKVTRVVAGVRVRVRVRV